MTADRSRRTPPRLRRTGPDTDARRTTTFEAFFADQEQDLLRFCWGLTLDRDRARDIAQEAMTRAWRDWDDLVDSNPVGWLRTVALNLVRNSWRSEQRGNAAVLRLTGSQREIRDDEVATLGSDVREALTRLSERQREAVVLHQLLDLPVSQVAEIMEIGEPAAKTHLQRGRATLAALLNPETDEGARHD